MRAPNLLVAGYVMVCGLVLFIITASVANMIDPRITGWARFATLVEKLFDRGFILPTVVSLLLICSPPVFVFIFRGRTRGQ